MKRKTALILLVILALSATALNASASDNIAVKRYEKGMACFASGDYEMAFSYFLVSGLEKGYAPAQNMLGICYRDGLGTVKNLDESVRYFRLAAEQGVQEASYHLAEIEHQIQIEIVATGVCGDNVNWTLNKDGVLTISGTGNIYDYNTWSNFPPWYEIRLEIKRVVINTGVERIGESSFSGCEMLRAVSIPSSVTGIGTTAFMNCRLLDNFQISSSVTDLGVLIFAQCDSMMHIDVDPENIKYYSVDGVLYTKDKSKLLAYPVGRIDQSFEIPTEVTEIEQCAFYGCKNLRNVSIPDHVSKIGFRAFDSCYELTGIQIPDGVVEIEGRVFDYCRSLKEVSIPTSIWRIAPNAFEGCEALSDIYYSGNEEQWSNIKIDTSNEPLLKGKIHFVF